MTLNERDFLAYIREFVSMCPNPNCDKKVLHRLPRLQFKEARVIYPVLFICEDGHTELLNCHLSSIEDDIIRIKKAEEMLRAYRV